MSEKFYSDVTELGYPCGLFYAGINRFRIFLCADCYYVVNDTTRCVVYAHELYTCVQMFMDAVRSTLGGVHQ